MYDFLDNTQKNQYYKNCYDKRGYFVIKNVFMKKDLKLIIKDIKLAKNTHKYYDQNNLIRRIEKFYDKSPTLKLFNKTIISLLNKIFHKKYTIFKDKYNAKPPGGEGFYAHYDGIFQFRNKKNKLENGWYSYGKDFLNVLVALDPCNKINGSIEISKAHKNNFSYLLNNTYKDGTPNLKNEKKNKFKLIELNMGDILIFKNTCPHRSKKNNSLSNRRTLYYTYSLLKFGSKYKKYFQDKILSKNKNSKSLSGEI